ncbi:hypothetical protein [Nakamurella lactea]|uniref:hypothetical protein n=1 Tax=Nakamurella lactea TaxID=459515 RepID=UPI000415342B|nr:hypothetical protein [Nakamurella lactea]
MKLTRRAQLAGAGAVAVVAVAAIILATRNSTAVFAGTDVRYATGAPAAVEAMCDPYSSDLADLVRDSESIVLATVTSETPLLANVYGTDAPKEVNGELPPRKGDFLNRALAVSIDKTLFGPERRNVVVVVEGWQYDTASDSWTPWAVNGNQRLMPGDRAVLSLMKNPADDPAALPGSFALACSGPFLIKDGKVVPKPDSTDFQDDGAYSMTEDQLIQAIEELAR